jgi:hypothetical protein
VVAAEVVDLELQHQVVEDFTETAVLVVAVEEHLEAQQHLLEQVLVKQVQ